jgi:formylglycine-generating enzyme required for sulfatase activity/class 3 adenylate cyclase
MRGEIHHLHPGNDAKPPHANTSRRLAAIIAGDISGYSRLMEIDEDGTHARVRRIVRDLLEPTIAEHHGRIVDTAGDGFIAVFDSPVEAVRCGIVIQQEMVARNVSLPREQWILYRIGINLGDVLFEGDGVYGDGINVAARLEGIAAPGQIYISGGIYEQVKHKLVCGYQSLGDRQVKNITDPVRVYRVLPDPSALIESRKRPGIILLAALAATILVIAGSAAWYLLTLRGGQIVGKVAAPVSAPAEVAKAPPQPAPAAPQSAPPAAQPAPTTPIAPKAAPEAPSTVGAVTPPVKQQPLPSITEPEMVSLPGGRFAMGSNDDMTERPIHQVAIKPFAIGKFPVTVREWNQCAAAKACGFTATTREDAPITDVSWNDAKQYAAWLAQVTRKAYRLPSEAEWEYAARGGTQTKYWWGDQFQSGVVNCKNCTDVAGAEQPIKVGSLKPNPFGLHDMGGGVDQWVEDCWHKNYQGAPSDGSPWLDGSGGECNSRVIRSGSWRNDARSARPASRDRYDAVVRYPTHGFRVALSP